MLSPLLQEGLFNRFVSEDIDQEGICAEGASLFHKSGASPGSLKSKYAPPGFNLPLISSLANCKVLKSLSEGLRRLWSLLITAISAQLGESSTFVFSISRLLA